MRSFWKKTIKIVSASRALPPNPRLPSAAGGSALRPPRCYSRLLLYIGVAAAPLEIFWPLLGEFCPPWDLYTEPFLGQKNAQIQTLYKKAEAPLARSKLRKKIRSFNFSQFCAYNPMKLLLQNYHTLSVI